MAISRDPAAELRRAINDAAAAAASQPVRVRRVESTPVVVEPLVTRVGSVGPVRVAPAPMANMPARRGGMMGGALAERPDLGASHTHYGMTAAPERETIAEEGDAPEGEPDEAK
ncbi:hypothetical protein ACNHKD_04260 [Methylocystis sp. JAN1]|uniref:hypothetical protein n=1 Tax=Methylocystis sp. JAN1 TaxID=3397211 RepID=UPI003FA32B65